MKKEVTTLLWMIILEESYMRKSIKMINRITPLLLFSSLFSQSIVGSWERKMVLLKYTLYEVNNI